jgi:hypothetical protein
MIFFTQHYWPTVRPPRPPSSSAFAREAFRGPCATQEGKNAADGAAGMAANVCNKIVGKVKDQQKFMKDANANFRWPRPMDLCLSPGIRGSRMRE